MNNWSVYIVRCSDGTFYTGVSNDVEKRVAKHNSGKGARYTSKRLPCELVVFKDGFTKSSAMKLEYKIKQMKRSEKVDFLRNYK